MECAICLGTLVFWLRVPEMLLWVLVLKALDASISSFVRYASIVTHASSHA